MDKMTGCLVAFAAIWFHPYSGQVFSSSESTPTCADSCGFSICLSGSSTMSDLGLTNKGLLGRGSYGEVYLMETDQREQFAVKVLEWSGANAKDRKAAENEVAVLESMCHENLLVYVASLYHHGSLLIITEYCSGGDLHHFLQRLRLPVPEELLLAWLWQMACGLEFLHTNQPKPVLHRDMKPGNIFLTHKGDIRLGDLGISKMLDSHTALTDTFCGTLSYMSPEMLREVPYNAKTDVWSLGCCVIEMATLRRAFPGSYLTYLLMSVMRTREPLPSPQYSDQLDGLVARMLLPTYEDRPSSTDILNHPLLLSYENKKPVYLLRKFNLLTSLGQPDPKVATSEEASAESTSSVSSTATSPSSTSTTLSVADITKGVKGLVSANDSLTIYRQRMENRTAGRRQDQTLTNSTAASSLLDTVIFKPGEVGIETKSLKKKPRVPSFSSSPSSTQSSGLSDSGSSSNDSLSLQFVSSLMSSLSTMRSKQDVTSPKSAVKESQLSSVSRKDSPMSHVSALKSVLTQMVSKEKLEAAGIILRSKSDWPSVRSDLSSLLADKEDGDLLTMVVCVFLMEASVKAD